MHDHSEIWLSLGDFKESVAQVLFLFAKRKKRTIKETEDLDLSSHSVRPVVELTTPQRNVTLEQTKQTDRLPGIDDRKDKTKSNREMLKATQMGMSRLQPRH